MIRIGKRYLNGKAVDRATLAARPVKSERVGRIVERVRGRPAR